MAFTNHMDPLEAITTAANALPAPIKTNIITAIARLITGAADVPAAWLENKAQAIRDDTAGRTAFARAAAAAAAKKAGTEPALIDRAVEHFGARILREQRNRESVAAIAIHELAAKPPTEDGAPPVSGDWLDMFARLAEGRSDADMQAYFGKLLAEEIRKPGSFSPTTMQVLSLLTPSVAKLFQSLCAITASFDGLHAPMAFVWCVPFGAPGQNGLQTFGLGYTELNILNSVGLIHGDWTAWRELPRIAFKLGVRVANTLVVEAEVIAAASEHLVTPVRSVVVNLAPAGLELRRIVHATPNAAYVEGLRAWITKELAEPTP